MLAGTVDLRVMLPAAFHLTNPSSFHIILSFRLVEEKFTRDRRRPHKEMSFAIIKTGGKQFNVEDGQSIRVPSINADAGEKIEVDAIVTGDGKKTSLGSSKVKATVINHGRADKIIVFKKKRRKGYKRRQGHRQGYTEIKIDKI